MVVLDLKEEEERILWEGSQDSVELVLGLKGVLQKPKGRVPVSIWENQGRFSKHATKLRMRLIRQVKTMQKKK